MFNASAFNFLDLLFLFFSFYIVGEVLYQRITDFNLRNPTNHFYEWTIFDLFTRVILMRYFKRIERKVLMFTFFSSKLAFHLVVYIFCSFTQKAMIVKRKRVEVRWLFKLPYNYHDIKFNFEKVRLSIHRNNIFWL